MAARGGKGGSAGVDVCTGVGNLRPLDPLTGENDAAGRGDIAREVGGGRAGVKEEGMECNGCFGGSSKEVQVVNGGKSGCGPSSDERRE